MGAASVSVEQIAGRLLQCVVMTGMAAFGHGGPLLQYCLACDLSRMARVLRGLFWLLC
jgi:hypothetical protein